MTLTEPGRVQTRWMDRAKQLAEDAQRLHDEMAYEAGFERVRINQVTKGDRLLYGDTPLEVVAIQPWVYEQEQTFRVTLADDVTQVTDTYDDFQFVSRVLPTIDEPF